jgi:hypothetical protein
LDDGWHFVCNAGKRTYGAAHPFISNLCVTFPGRPRSGNILSGAFRRLSHDPLCSCLSCRESSCSNSFVSAVRIACAEYDHPGHQPHCVCRRGGADSYGRIVRGLTEKVFGMLEDGKPQHVDFFRDHTREVIEDRAFCGLDCGSELKTVSRQTERCHHCSRHQRREVSLRPRTIGLLGSE